jgi:AmmeMemoRadiSam system protein B
MNSARLPRIRLNLDFMPSPVADRPGLLIRDPFRYSDVTAIIPPALVPCLQFFDGVTAEEDLLDMLRRLSGSSEVNGLARHLIDTLSGAAFLEDEAYLKVRDLRHRQFAAAPLRDAIHAGSAYPEDASEVRETLDRYLHPGHEATVTPKTPGPAGRLTGIAAPHVSPEGGWRSYAAAYRALDRDLSDRTFVILGTSHYGEPERFGLTRKPFVTPLGRTTVDTRLVDELRTRAPEATLLEDYCHSVEHSIEFQVLFLQHLFGAQVKILPILCGAFARSLMGGSRPEDDPAVARFFEALGNLQARDGERLFWVLGVDMAHMGRRYGDSFEAHADCDDMLGVAERDRARLDCIAAGDAAAFWDLVQPNRDDLKWCGTAPVYTFLKAVPGARGSLLRYEQWNIDAQSVVSFAGIAFRSS